MTRRGHTLSEMNTSADLMLAPPWRDPEDPDERPRDTSRSTGPRDADGWLLRSRRPVVTIRCVPGRLTSEDLCNACPAACELSCVPIPAELGSDLTLRRGWIVELLTADDDPASRDELALFLGRLLLIDPDMRVKQ